MEVHIVASPQELAALVLALTKGTSASTEEIAQQLQRKFEKECLSVTQRD